MNGKTSGSSVGSSAKRLGGPNTVTWTLYGMVSRLAAESAQIHQPDIIKQNGLAAVFLGVNTIESFTNIFFRVVASEPQFKHAERKILGDLEKRNFPLHKKLLNWPQLAFGRSIDENDQRWKDFIALRDQRNAFMHFKSSHETIELPDKIFIEGLADISDYENLSEQTPHDALECARGVVELIGDCRGETPQQIPHFVHQWLGIPPQIAP